MSPALAVRTGAAMRCASVGLLLGFSLLLNDSTIVSPWDRLASGLAMGALPAMIGLIFGAFAGRANPGQWPFIASAVAVTTILKLFFPVLAVAGPVLLMAWLRYSAAQIHPNQSSTETPGK